METSTILGAVGLVLVAAGLVLLLLGHHGDRSDGVPIETTVGDVQVRSSRPSLFLVGVGVALLVFAAHVRQGERAQEMFIGIDRSVW